MSEASAGESRVADPSRRAAVSPAEAPAGDGRGLDVGLLVETRESQRLLAEARPFSPHGVQGAGRWYNPFPLFMKRAQGARVWDVDGNCYVDYHAAYGPAVLGHNDRRVGKAVVDTLDQEGVLFGTPHPKEVALTRLFAELIPCAEQTIICGGGGSDAIYNAVRVARAFTGRTKVLKFEGGYHGWHDELAASVRPALGDAGPLAAPRTVPVSPRGSLPTTLEQIVIAPLNDRAAVEQIVERERHQLAAIVVEPVCHSAGCILLEDGFLALLRQLCDAHGIVLIFDEIITGFRHHPGGAQTIFGVTPDLAAFGKAMTNGFSASALSGKRKIMSLFAPEGPVFLSGTFMGHLLGVSAALATIEILRDPAIHAQLFRHGNEISTRINAAIERLGLDARCNNFGSVWCLYFTRTVRSYRDIAHLTAAKKENPKDQAYRRTLLNNGVYIQPNYINKAFVSAAHSDADIDRTIELTVKFLSDYQAHLR
jgi:glutamate-1-semialdehyde 2,1-aminomutase